MQKYCHLICHSLLEDKDIHQQLIKIKFNILGILQIPYTEKRPIYNLLSEMNSTSTKDQ